MSGLYPDNRRVRPTGRMFFHHLGEVTLRISSVTDPTGSACYALPVPPIAGW